MPGFTTHYLFGVSTYQELSDPLLHRIIHTVPTAYGLGLQGPDVFFYYLPSYLIHEKNIGSIAHTTHPGQFLRALIDSVATFRTPAEKEIAIAYIAGFIGHYTLDTCCHPYVYARTHYRGEEPGYFGRHVFLETDIDGTLLFYYKRLLPSQFHQEATIRLNARERKVVAHVLTYAYRTAYPELHISYATMYAAIICMHCNTHALRDPHGVKKLFTRRMEEKLIGYPILSPLIPSDHLHFTRDCCNLDHRTWSNPWEKEERHHPIRVHSDSFFDLFADARTQYLGRLHLLEQYMTMSLAPFAEVKRRAAVYDRLLHALGSNSYHRGQPCE